MVETLSVSIRVCLASGCGAQAGDLFRLLGIVLTGWLCAHCCSALMHDITFALSSASCLSRLAIVPRFLWQPLHKTANGSFSIRCKGSGPDNATNTCLASVHASLPNFLLSVEVVQRHKQQLGAGLFIWLFERAVGKSTWS